MAKIDIISGFLGAGKTTLIKKLLSEGFKGEQVVLIENEFGEIGIDGGFLKEAGIEIREMNSGCICCSLVGDFGQALKEVTATYHPDRVIIEPSGVGKLSDVIRAVEKAGAEAGLELNSFTTVVDVNKAKMYLKNFGEFFSNQVQYARTIILSRTDTEKATAERVEEVVALLRALNPNAAIVTTPIAQLDGAKILNTMEKGQEGFVLPAFDLDDDDEDEHEHHHHHHDDDDEEHEHHHHHDDDDEDEHEHHHHGGHHYHHHHHGHDADEIFTSWGLETTRRFTKEEIDGILQALSDENGEYGVILRAKGIVAGEGSDWLYFDMVPEEYEIRTGAPEITGKYCVIGSNLKEDRLAELFAAK